METTKKLFQSKTFWFNIACVVIGASATVGADELISLGITGVAQKWALVVLGGVTTIGNIYLRMVTNVPIKLTKKS